MFRCALSTPAYDFTRPLAIHIRALSHAIAQASQTWKLWKLDAEQDGANRLAGGIEFLTDCGV
jgi:hypothetical protein